ncbi:TonB-dependent receptor [Hymenobacter sp. BT507]|uniref:TonB-dependent receptor n=1 Tax=Hymenobacter citatus TaxID=2763506 RepID=A0ABR7MKL3_9BACT|nr:TonB-dependent receptor [Hymenobacter citatus]MBC6611629.1 TonB-dependent receptor [Hymenobacter citatus]
MKHSFTRYLVVALLLLLAHVGWTQGVTTSAMNGTITDQTGSGLPGATIIAVHTPTNTQYVAPTNSDGRFNIQNMRVGGPYTVRVTFVGYQDFLREGVYLTLGQNLRLDVNLSEATQQLGEVVVSGRQDPVINSNRTGAATTVQREQIERLPTLNRSLNDFTRLTPQANGQSFGGRNSGYNNITVDGAIFNNAFGLSSTVGGQASAQPISLDAIDQIQVAIAPYDVRQGSFTGAGINVVTRSGTNKFSGSVYGFYRNQDLVGDKVGDVKNQYPKFNLKNYGFRVGGPIIKDKLFFFINGEQERRTDPPNGNFIANRAATAPATGSQTSQANANDLDFLSNFLQQQYGYNPGPYEGYNQRANSDKATIKIDWNINQNNRFNIKYNYLKSYADINPSTSGAIGGNRAQSQFGLPFFSSYYTINNNLNSFIAELNSTIGGGKFSNNLTAGYSAFRDFRQSPGGSIFPLVDIGNSVGRSTSTAAINGIQASNTLTSFGYEPFTAFNILNSDVYQLGDNFTAYLGKHNVTVGTYNEYYKFRNGFAPNYYGNYSFNSLEDFYASAGYNYTRSNGTSTPSIEPLAAGVNRPGPARYNLQYSALPGGEFPYADIQAMQLGLYVQDEWSPRSNFKLTYGLRADLPFLTSDLLQNTNAANLTFRDGVKINTSATPKERVLFSPRVGFNWDANDDKKTQVRGGTGIFTGRVPFVWLSNQASNNGVQFGSYSLSGSNTVNPVSGTPSYFNGDVNAYRPENATANTAYNLAVTDKDFKFPQVWRSNLAIDQQLPGGIIATLEGFYTKDLNAVYHQNVNLPQPLNYAVGATENNRIYAGDRRPIFYTLGAAQTGANAGLVSITRNERIYGGQGTASAANPNISDAILMKNTNKGYSYAVTAQLQKSFVSGFYVSAAYTYSDSRSVNDGGSIAQSIWRDRQISGDPNADVLSYSQFLQKHRIIASGSYRKEYLGHLGTTISLFYEAAPQSRFSYVYAGDMNGDNQNANDLMYIPRNASEVNLRDIVYSYQNQANQSIEFARYTAAQQYADLNAYIQQDDYLSKNRGKYAERNGGVRPWQNRLDARLLQDIFTNIGENRNTLQLSIDIFNIGNLINSDWGVFQTPNKVNPLSFSGYNTQGQPVFTFPNLTNPTRNATTGAVTPGTPLTKTFRNDTGGIGSRWQGQIGLRYIFN